MKLTKNKQGFDELDLLLMGMLKSHTDNDNVLTVELLQDYRKQLMTFLFNINR